ncbi:nuclear transport factor 2 family protein [Bradyrhizobium sp. BR 1433]|uniref:nuclear transport factor 2 family protein n=1 Tax=Bradyrhizobium sp. BR 1433 TaxID=3447967 RepID=UPI003EE529D6
MAASVRKLFERYERCFGQALAGDVNMDEVRSFYAAEFIAASPHGIMTGKNDEKLMQAMSQGYAHYRSIGTTAMRMRNLQISTIDDGHCMAHVAWTATYVRDSQPDVTIDFDVHYLVQTHGAQPTIFGWVTGDEQALLRKHGII